MSDNKIQLSGIFTEGYGIIPKKLMKMKIPQNLKLILAYMLSYTGAGDTCFPGIRTISNDLGMSATTVTKYIKQGVELKLISKSKYNNNPMNHANKYKLLFLSDVISYSNIDVPAYDNDDVPVNKDNDVTTGETPMCQQVEQNNNTINNNNDNNIYIYTPLLKLFETWKSSGLTVHSLPVLKKALTKKHLNILNAIDMDQARESIRNYAKVKNGDEYYFTHSWTFWDFIARGLYKFMSENKPLECYKKMKSFKMQQKEDEKTAREKEIERLRGTM